MIEAEPQPTLNFNNNGDLALMLRRDGYKSIEDLAIEELRIGGTRIDPVRYTSSRMTYYNSFSLLDINTGEIIEFVDNEIEVLQKKVAEKYGYNLVDHKLELYGIKKKS